MKRRIHPRGSALLTTMIMATIVLMAVAGLLYYVQLTRANAARESRRMPRNYCADTGLQLARRYYGQNYPGWNSYLANPGVYNPIKSSHDTVTPADPSSATLQANHPELFADLDGDGKNDVYIYIRDNADEPGAQNWQRDNDLSVYVGAICISSTLVPRLPNGEIDTAVVSSEGLLVYHLNNDIYAQRCTAIGNCNGNR